MSHPCEILVERALPGFRLSLEARWDAGAIAIFGASGAGKSTLLEILAGIRRADRARVVLHGRLLEDSDARLYIPAEKRGLGWVPQDAALFPHLTVAENVQFGLRRAKGPASVTRAIEMLELGRILDRRPRDLSGGERQRVAFARALASDPSMLLLDEPLAALDLPLRARIFPYLVRLRDAARVPIVYVTHDAAEALGLAMHVLIMEEGRLVASGSAEDLLRSPAALRLLDLVGLENRFVVATAVPVPETGLLRIRTHGGLDLAAPQGFAALPGELVGIRAEDILIAIVEPRGLSAQNVLPGVVTGAAEQAGRVLVTVRCPGEMLTAAVTRHAFEDLRLAPGRPAWLIVKAHAIHRLGQGESPPHRDGP